MSGYTGLIDGKAGESFTRQGDIGAELSVHSREEEVGSYVWEEAYTCLYRALKLSASVSGRVLVCTREGAPLASQRPFFL